MNLPILILGGLAVVLAGVVMSSNKTPGPTAKLPTGANFALVKSLAEKWSKVFSVPVPMILTIAQIESSFRPGLYNTNDRAMLLGGAYGVVAMTLKTGAGKVEQIRKAGLDKRYPQIASTLAKWNPAATTANVVSLIGNRTTDAVKNRDTLVRLAQPLLDPDLCLMLGVYMLSGLWAKYKGDYQKVAAAYHSGSGPVDAAIKAAVPVTSKLGQYGKEYVARADKIWPIYKGVA